MTTYQKKALLIVLQIWLLFYLAAHLPDVWWAWAALLSDIFLTVAAVTETGDHDR
jgi:hypothetical protein